MNKTRIYVCAVAVLLTMTAGNVMAGIVTPPSVPEPASTAALLSLSFAGLALGRKFLRK